MQERREAVYHIERQTVGGCGQYIASPAMSQRPGLVPVDRAASSAVNVDIPVRPVDWLSDDLDRTPLVWFVIVVG